MIAWLLVLVLPRIGWIALVLAAGRHGRRPRPPRRRAAAADRRAAAGAADAALGAGLAAAGGRAGTRIGWARRRLAGGRGTGVELPVAPGGARVLRLGVAGPGSPLAAADLYTRRPAGIPAPDVWTASLSVTLTTCSGRSSAPGVLAAAPVWALAAVVLPWLVRGRSLPLDLVLVTIWAATTVSATDTVIALAHHGAGASTAPGAIAGAIAGGLLALSPTLAQAWRSRRSGKFRAELP